MSLDISTFLHSGAIVSLSPDKLLIGWGKARQGNALDREASQPSFYFSDFFLMNSSPWVQFAHWTEVSHKDLNAQLEWAAQTSISDWKIHHPEQFRHAFDALQQLLQQGSLQKAVPYLFTYSSHRMTPERLQNCLKRALVALERKAGYLYGYWEETQGILGVTPEMLFTHSEHQPLYVQTMAVAGTRSSHSMESLMENEKEQIEHQLVVQGICQSLQSRGTVIVGPLQLLQLPTLTHLKTPIEVQLNHPFCFETLVHCLHPTPALGAFPVDVGKVWLQKYQEHTPRGYYGAPVGFQHPQMGLSHCLVAIRNVQWDASGMRIGAGCGVVKPSVFDKEWQEIQFKIQAIQEQLAL